jgi:hypothetical protein
MSDEKQDQKRPGLGFLMVVAMFAGIAALVIYAFTHP